MSKESLMEALGYLDEELIENYFSFQDNGCKETTSHAIWWRYLAMVAVACIIITGMIHVAPILRGSTPVVPGDSETESSEMPGTPEDSETELPIVPEDPEFEFPVDVEEIIWKKDNSGGTVPDDAGMEWNGLWISLDLYEALENADASTYIAIGVWYSSQSMPEADFAERAYEELAKEGYYVTIVKGHPVLFATKEEFINLRVENPEKYQFSHVSKRLFEPKKEVEVPVITDEVSGFNLEKLHIGERSEYGEVKEDKDVVLVLNRMMENWKYTYDYFEFTFYCRKEVEEELFAGMDYESFQRSKYPTRVTLHVKYENINLEKLKELSNKNEISSIWISQPLIPLPETE